MFLPLEVTLHVHACFIISLVKQHGHMNRAIHSAHPKARERQVTTEKNTRSPSATSHVEASLRLNSRRVPIPQCTMVLCSRCAKIDFGLLIERACTEPAVQRMKIGFFPYPSMIDTVSYAVIRDAAIWGCDLCSLIQRGLLDRMITWLAPADLTDDTIVVMSVVLERCYSDLAPIQVQCGGLEIQCFYGNEDLDKTWNRIGLTLAS